MIVHYLIFGHKIMSTLFFIVNTNDTEGHSSFSIDVSIIHLGGSADVGIKSLDFSLYENHLMKHPLIQAWLTVVWEMDYSENEQKLVYDLGRYVVCSLSRVQLAIGVKIECNPAVPGGQQP